MIFSKKKAISHCILACQPRCLARSETRKVCDLETAGVAGRTIPTGVKSFVNLLCGGGQGGGRPGERGWEVYTGGGSRGGRKGDSQGGGKREKNEKIAQHFAIFCNRKNAKRRKSTNKGPEPKSKGKGSGRC